MLSAAGFELDLSSPVVCTAIHNGHNLSPAVSEIMRIDESARLREEDPFTADFIAICKNRIVANYSRFEFDLNRPREKAIYQKPADAWGLNVWQSSPSREILENSLQKYDEFYSQFEIYLKKLLQKFPVITVFDIHSYNHRRKGPEAPLDDPNENPDIILGTLNRNTRWGNHYKKIAEKFRKGSCLSKLLDVRFNVKFPGGYLQKWIKTNFPDSICCISVEFKKIFMDEWTGKLNNVAFSELKKILSAVITSMEQELSK